jgi:hypothetical protein
LLKDVSVSFVLDTFEWIAVFLWLSCQQPPV